MIFSSRNFRLPPLYAILDPEQTKGRPAASVLAELLQGGVTLLQLRAKTLTSSDLLRLAKKARDLTLPAHCRLIINDRLDIALACNADGVHLGQEDLPLSAARKLMPDKIVGVSTHDLEQATQAERDGVDYVGFGPIFGTTTKDTGYTARGLAMLRQVRQTVRVPIVAIGGITEANVAEIWEAGADSAAIISDLLGAEEITTKTKRIVASGAAR